MVVKQFPRKPSEPEPAADDTAIRSLSKVDRSRLAMDAWEPSLLRKLLSAQNRLKRGK